MLIICKFDVIKATKPSHSWRLETLAWYEATTPLDREYSCLVLGDLPSFVGFCQTENLDYTETTEIPQHHATAVCNVEEHGSAYVAYNEALKYRVRQKLSEAIGDPEDMLADVSKRLALVERLVIRVMLPFLKGEPVPEHLKMAYIPLLEAYIFGIDTGVVKDRVDYEDTATVFNELAIRATRVAEIVDVEYLSLRHNATQEQ